jgi:hypothetical protein
MLCFWPEGTRRRIKRGTRTRGFLVVSLPDALGKAGAREDRGEPRYRRDRSGNKVNIQTEVQDR